MTDLASTATGGDGGANGVGADSGTDVDPFAEYDDGPRFSIRRVVGPQLATPLLILWGLNAVDELDRAAFTLLAPEIRDAFDLDNQGILSVVTLVVLLSLGFQPFIGYLADRSRRIRIAAGGASAWAFFSVMTGFAPTVVFLVLARSGSAIGRLVNDPTHNSLLADYYEPKSRTRVYGFHRSGNQFGQILGPLAAGLLASAFGFRAPFFVFAVPTVILIVIAVTRMREPIRGAHERRSLTDDQELIDSEEAPPSFAESWRICNQVATLRRVWLSLPFLALAFIGLAVITSIFYEEVLGLSEAERGFIAAVAEPFQLLGIVVGIPIATRLAERDVSLVLKMIGFAGVITGGFLLVLAAAPNTAVAVVANCGASAAVGTIAPGIYSTLSLVIPPRARALGFSIGSLYIALGAVLLPVIGGVADDSGARAAIVALVPILLLGSFILASAGTSVADDIAKVRSSTLAQAEVAKARRDGTAKLLLVKDLDVGYGSVQVLFNVDFEIDEGEIVALLGTNGAGKSTLLKAISGINPASAGAVIFDGADMTSATPQEIAARGVVQVPGGKGVFPGLTVAENLKIAGWLYQKDEEYLAKATEEVLDFFPILRRRWDEPAGNMSGGEQQMLTLGQAFIMQPKLLMIDELSLGLAPVIVEQLLEIVRAIQQQGTTIIVVEQSVNVALTIAETAFFMEKGEIRFKGPTSELLERPDVLRSVFLEGAAASGRQDGQQDKAESKLPEPAEDDADADSLATTFAAIEPGPMRTTPRRAPVLGLDGSAPPVLAVRGVSKSFGGIRATNDVTFELADGEILGFIGPNGAGKTTLFDLISGYLDADRGRIEFAGFDVTQATPDTRARLGLGRSFQDARLFPALTVRDTIALALERHLGNRDPVAAALNLPVVADTEAAVSERVDELIDLMAVGAFADKFVSELSTGSRRIVDLACILAHEPDVLLFDEPSSGIAQKETEALGPLLLRIREATGSSLLVIEHDMPLITSISDRIVALDLGTIVTAGSPAEVLDHPQVIAAYLGGNEATIHRSGGPDRSADDRRAAEVAVGGAAAAPAGQPSGGPHGVGKNETIAATRRVRSERRVRSGGTDNG